MEEYEAEDALASAALDHSVGGELRAFRPDDRSLRHLVSGLFADHILGGPIRPVWVGLPSLFLVLAVLFAARIIAWARSRADAYVALPVACPGNRFVTSRVSTTRATKLAH
jgi:hypothetical protein